MDITITVADRHIEALCKTYNFKPDPDLSDIQIALAKQDFAKKEIVKFINETTKAVNGNAGAENGRTQALLDEANLPQAVIKVNP